MKNLIFLCASTAIVIFTVIVLNNAPIINRLVGTDWYNESCQNYVDLHKYYKDKTPAEIAIAGDYGVSNEDNKKEWLDLLIEGKNKCYRNKAMIGLEYTAFNFNIVFGFTCALLGLFNYLKIGNLGKIVGLIGLGSGIIGFVLTLVYIIYSGIIFTKDVAGKTFTNIINKYNDADPSKIKANGAFAEWDDSKKGYVCLFYEKDNEDSLYLTYSDYGNIHLNYRTKDLYPEEGKNYKFIGCRRSSTYSYTTCKANDESNNLGRTKEKYYETYENYNANKNEKGECDYLYYFERGTDNSRRNIYDRWVLTIVFGCFIFVLDIGLAIFGFLIFKDGGSSGTPL
jgi:hypothetical protein